MQTRPWSFLSNPFQTATNGSFIKAMLISTTLDAALNAAKADAAILVLYNLYHPIHVAYKAAYDAWYLQNATQISGTANMQALIDGLTNNVNQWDAKVQVLFPKNTSAYKGFFPNGHSPFQSGSDVERIAAVGALDAALALVVPVPAVHADVDAYYQQLLAAINVHDGQMSTTGSKSTTLEAQRIAMCNGQYTVLGGLMQKYSTNTAPIASFFNLSIIMSRAQKTFVGSHLAPEKDVVICQRTLHDTDNVLLINAGPTILRFYAAAQKTDPIGATFIAMPPMTSQSHPASDLGNIATNHFIKAYNSNTTQEGSWELDL